jgi:hypothetical protein
MLGSTAVEAEFYQALSSSAEDDEINRGYHLYYYGDRDAPERSMPVRDRGEGDAYQALKKLFERLQRTEHRHRSLRRIELLTIKRFLETNRKAPIPISSAEAIISSVVNEFSNDTTDYGISVRREAEAIVRLLKE